MDCDLKNGAKDPRDPHEYDIEKEAATNRNMLEKRIPGRLNTIKLTLIVIEKRQTYEPWRLALTIDLVDGIECNCEEQIPCAM